ncbi:MAG TPA: hypothetical protein EYP33_02310 [Pyrodictium sp.]|nr:hypothetical protein [Pyrodictium sp.]
MRKALLLSSIFPVFSLATDSPMKTLLKKLEEKGILTEKEVKTIEKTANKSFHPIVKIRLQPRIDFGDIYKDGDNYKTKSDFYFRRVRLEISKKWKNIPIGESLKINFTLQADKAERDYDYKKGKRKHTPPSVKVKYAYADWKIVDEFSVRLGIKKLPYSRVSLTSSSRQLLIERPYSTEDAKKWLGEYDNNHILFHGKIAKGIFRYMVAIGDGSSIADENKTGKENVQADTKILNLYAIRLEFSPPGFVEKKKDDTGIGEKNKGNAISFGISYAENSKFDVGNVNDEKGTVWGVDLFGRFQLGPGILVAQAEYVKMKYDKLDKDEKGWYIQGGYLFDTEKFGKVEPAFRYENVDYGDSDRKITTLGFNHYFKGHKIKWAYNILFIDNDDGDNQTVHQIQAQFYF